ncbi:hypothetical protein F7734_28125 [Scytonema sp. UIC 10036]|nr:hypothetical protein [Scytonema sp. UIC 10036]
MPRSANDHVFVRARVPKDIHLRFKIACLKAGSDMDSVLNQLIIKWLQENEEDK